MPRIDQHINKDHAGRAEVRWGTTPIAFDQRANGVAVRFSDGRSDFFHLVIGVDGIHSLVREQLFGSASKFERYLGFRVADFDVSG